jgi:heat shock protein HslJ
MPSALIAMVGHHGGSISMIALIALAVALGGCSPSPADSASLEGTHWALVTLRGEPPLTGTTPSAEFSADQLSGSTGCNHYFGTYQVSGSDITISDVARTEMYCADPEGVMDQEDAFVAALASVASYRLTGEQLELLDATDTAILAFEPPPAVPDTPTAAPPTPTLAPATRTPAQPTPTAAAAEPAAPAIFQPPVGFKKYQDAATGISVYVPESWTVTGVLPGQSAILQSYPEDKYIGGEALEPGDTKCDLTIRPPDVSVADAIRELRSDALATIVSEQEIVLRSGELGIRMEVESMGPSISLFTEVNERTVVLTCFGELAPFDEVAGTLSTTE